MKKEIINNSICELAQARPNCQVVPATDDIEVCAIEINGIVLSGAALDPTTHQFSATLPVIDGTNVITAVAYDCAGNSDSASISITASDAGSDLTPPGNRGEIGGGNRGTQYSFCLTNV